MRNLLAIMLLSLAGCTTLSGQKNAVDELYNQKPFSKINLENSGDFSGLKELEIYIEGPRVFMTGENHQHVAVNGLIEFKLLRFLHERAGVRHLLLELGDARGWYANRYINNIDTQAKYCLQATTSVEHMKILDSIREWNLSFPIEERIEIHGIDVERFNDIALLRLSDLLPKKGVPESLYTTVHAVHQVAGLIKNTGLIEFAATSKNEVYTAGYTASYVDESIDLIVAQFDSLDKDLKNWLGRQYPEVQSGINSLREYRQWNQYRKSAFYYTWREENLYRRLTGLLDKDSFAKFFGQFGRCHTAYTKQDGDCGWYAYQSVIHRLNERYFHSNRGTLSVGIFYNEEKEQSVSGPDMQDVKLQNEISQLINLAPDESVSILRLEESQYPKLGSKFSFFIAVRERRKVTKTVISQKSSALLLTFGLTSLNLKNDKNIMTHVNPSWYGPYQTDPYFTIGLNWNVKKFNAAIQLGSNIYNDLYPKTAELSLRYEFRIVSAYAGFTLLESRKIRLDAGPQIFHATQSIKCRRYTGGFLNPDPAYLKVVNNHAAGAGGQLRMNFRLHKHMKAGLAAGYLYDISAPDWFFAKTNLYYAHNLLQTRVRGSSYSVFINFDL